MPYTTAEAGGELGPVIGKVKSTGRRVALISGGKPVAAVVPIEDLEYLEALEAREDTEDEKACEAAEKESMRPFSEVREELGL